MLLSLSDDDVLELLAALGVDPEECTPDQRRKLLRLALQQAQRVGKVLEAAGSSQLDPGAFVKLSSGAARNKAVSDAWDTNALLSVQETLSTELDSEWLHLRRTLQEHVTGFAADGIRRMKVKTHDGALSGVVDILGVRKAPGGKPLLELRTQFYELASALPVYLEAERRSTPHDRFRTVEMAPRRLRLMAALFDASTACLDPGYIEARKATAGRQFDASVLLPLRPLLQDVKLPKACKVCDKEGAKGCSACHTVAYCGRDCQMQDWKAHKPACKKAQAAAAAERSTPGSVVVDLSGGLGMPDVAVAQVLPINVSSRVVSRAAKAEPQWMDGQPAPSQVPPDPTARFIVKIQAPLSACSEAAGTALLLYDEKRRVMAQISSRQQPQACAQLLAVIRSVGFMGAKAYFWAVQETPDKLVVMTDSLPGQTHNW